MFHEKIHDSLLMIIQEYGNSICKEPYRLESLLKDCCGEYKKEIFILVASAKEGIPFEISRSNDSLEIVRNRLSGRLVDNLAFSAEYSDATVLLWFLVFGKITFEEYENMIAGGKASAKPAASIQTCNKKPVETMFVRDMQYAGCGGNEGKYTGSIDVENKKPLGEGICTYANGQKYVGNWIDGQFNGQGIWISPKFKYVGNFKDGRFGGYGTFTKTYDNNVIEIAGNWNGYAINGYGTWTSLKVKYVGNFKDGKMDGLGTFTDANGNKYIGNFKDYKRNGQGTMTCTDGDKYVGNWEDDERTGQGTMTFASGKKYVGNWKDGKMDGQGIFTDADGNKYIGNFKDYKRNGQGTMTYADGNKYVGYWKDDQRNGQGTMIYADGKMKTGIWENGKLTFPR